MIEIPNNSGQNIYVTFNTSGILGGAIYIGYIGGDVHAAIWNTTTGEMLNLGTLGGVAMVHATNTSGDVVVGDSGVLGANGYHVIRGFRWTQAKGQLEDLGTLGGTYSSARAINAVGDVVVGLSDMPLNANNRIFSHAFRWTEASGKMEDLGTLGGLQSVAHGVNAIGDVVVGESDIPEDANGNEAQHAFRWTQAKGKMEDLHSPINGDWLGYNSSAHAVNAAGDVVVGVVRSSDLSIGHAFRWTEAKGKMESLGTLGGNSFAVAVNAKGDVVVGQAMLANGDPRAFRWTETSGMQSVEDWLAAHGVIVKGANTNFATGVNDRGDVVTGLLQNGSGFLARVTGMIDVSEFKLGLYRVANSALLAVNDAGLVMHGAHGNPMRSLLPVGRSSFWAAGDVGRQDHGVYNSKQGVAEIGYGYRPTQAMQLNIALGHTYSSADTGFGGNTTARSTYVFPELILSVPDSSTKATLSTYYGQGDLRIDRAYLNAGNLTHAYGKPDTETLGARARLDWVDAITIGKTSLTPYTSLTYMETRLDGYTEQGNGFPVQWNKRTEHATTARIGFDATHPVSNTVTVLGRLEATHRFENRGTTASGLILGPGGFPYAFKGQDLNRTWLRTGLGLEAKVGNGIASAMLNATTQGEMPTYWLAANYRWMF
nr:autotransporter domain-containing protein [Janthinobacterium sp. Marseille]